MNRRRREYEIGDRIHGWEVIKVRPMKQFNSWFYVLKNNDNKMSADEETLTLLFARLDNLGK